MTTLSAVKSYMEKRHRASVAEIAIGLDTTPEVVRSLLEMWRMKKKVRHLTSICATCGKAGTIGCACAAGAELGDIYEWVDAPQANPDGA